MSAAGHEAWFPQRKRMIRMIKERPIIYINNTSMSVRKHKAALAIAWEEVAADINLPCRTCITIWRKIKFIYAKLQMLINSGTITKEVAMSRPKTSRFLDGELSFLDPHISNITETDIPIRIHKDFDSIFGLITCLSQAQNDYSHVSTVVTHEQVEALLKIRKEEEDDSDNTDMQYLHNIIASVIKHKLQEILPNKNSTPKNILEPSQENINKNKEMRDRSNLGLESELIIADHSIKTEKDDEDSAMTENLTIENNINEMTDTAEINNAMELIVPDRNIHMTVGDDTINNTLKVSNVNAMIIEDNAENIKTMTGNEISNLLIGVNDNQMRKFFSELGEVMSMELPIQKQKILKLRINTLVRNILEEV